MANLTEISIFTRKFFVWLVLAFIGYLILKIIISFGIGYWAMTHPPTLPLPNVLFGKIPKPVFPLDSTTSAGLNFSLQNIEGRPPESTGAGKVYSMPKKLPTLLSPERALKFAAKLGFLNQPDIVQSTNYHFTDPAEPDRTLSLDIVNMNFHLKYDYQKNPQIFEKVKFQTKHQPLTEVKNYLRFNNLFDESIINGKTTLDLLIYDPINKRFKPATSLSTTQAVRINFFKTDLETLKILPPKFNLSYISVLYAPSPGISSPIIEISYTFWPIAFDDFGTYPLISGTSAWEELVKGNAAIISMGNNTSGNIVIRNIYMAYYDSEDPQLFLQPIFVFEGDNNFVAYLPAIIPDWLE